ncbi:hypothetical protein S7711_03372 [Stachybotrys chartarum IBT 7711]|uniref:Uncharacterized protein n=1 Tax=Stachybotrys chartarum (strain CBS 109288 / IBT 7711) TaxID=1280523 RepID=A0A084AXV8_STACB|nr:hypothetical protein S7711_03372 [Stachybotrys chartarum IBT 7711]KFA46837.1 hypothetical protein S40293_05594 [Stachybotrys chartarum IBT 40293]KFA71927.1 hypothetical protein S40288_06729 [Stachybotrys chartarum IBT 40288]
MIDHTGINPSKDKFQETHHFYLEALKPLGYVQKLQFGPTVVGMGPTQTDVTDYNQANFWLTGMDEAPNHAAHIAFRAQDRAVVDAFHAAALKAGGKDNGAPGLRPHYHANYYGAFVIDPIGNNIEVVCHAAP